MNLTIHKTRFAELGFTRLEKSCWRFIDTTTGANVGPFYRSKAELIADMARYAASFGCAEPDALRQLPSMPAYGNVAIDTWEPVLALPCNQCGEYHLPDWNGLCEDASILGKSFSSERTGYVKRTGWRAVTDIRNDLAATLALHLPDEWSKLDYFSTRMGAPAAWCQGVIACFPLVGGNEGYYFHVDVIVPRDNMHKPDQWHSMILGKTLSEGEEGFAVVSRLAIACARLLGA